MANGILASALLAGGEDPAAAVPVASPQTGVWVHLDIAWGVGENDPAAVLTTTLTCTGATIDTQYGPAIRGHGVGGHGRRSLDLGWAPDGKAVFLNAAEAALGIWRMRFPAAGNYTANLAGVGTLAITAIGSAPSTLFPNVQVLHPSPLNRQPSKLLQLTYNGAYPAGGLDLPSGRIGLTGILFADLNDDATYRYTWSDEKLRAWRGSGEATGVVSLATVGLFLGLIG
jgi:hypothetical protein